MQKFNTKIKWKTPEEIKKVLFECSPEKIYSYTEKILIDKKLLQNFLTKEKIKVDEIKSITAEFEDSGGGYLIYSLYITTDNKAGDREGLVAIDISRYIDGKGFYYNFEKDVKNAEYLYEKIPDIVPRQYGFMDGVRVEEKIADHSQAICKLLINEELAEKWAESLGRLWKVTEKNDNGWTHKCRHTTNVMMRKGKAVLLDFDDRKINKKTTPYELIEGWLNVDLKFDDADSVPFSKYSDAFIRGLINGLSIQGMSRRGIRRFLRKAMYAKDGSKNKYFNEIQNALTRI